MGHQKSVTLLDDLPIEKGIVGAILKVKKLKEKDLMDVSLVVLVYKYGHEKLNDL